MLRLRSTVALGLLLALPACTTSFRTSDLDGTWIGRDHTINSRGQSVTSKEIVLQVDDNGLINGTTTWALIDGAGGNDGDAPVAGDTEDIIGVFDATSGEFYLVETEERGFWRGRMLSRDRIQAFLVQSGDRPVAAVVRLQRRTD